MTTNLYRNAYLISIVEPINNKCRKEALRVDIYEHLDPIDDSYLGPRDLSIKHVRWISSFPLNNASLDEVVQITNRIIKKRIS
jgi:hypothetical protein